MAYIFPCLIVVIVSNIQNLGTCWQALNVLNGVDARSEG